MSKLRLVVLWIFFTGHTSLWAQTNDLQVGSSETGLDFIITGESANQVFLFLSRKNDVSRFVDREYETFYVDGVDIGCEKQIPNGGAPITICWTTLKPFQEGIRYGYFRLELPAIVGVSN